MPAKGKKKAVPKATKPERAKGPRTPHQQYEVEQRIWTDISNAMYEAGARVAEWIKEGGEKQDKRIWAAVEGTIIQINLDISMQMTQETTVQITQEIIVQITQETAVQINL